MVSPAPVTEPEGAEAGGDTPQANGPEPVEEVPPKAHQNLHDRVVVLDRDSARQALQQLSGSWNASVLTSVWDDSRFMREAVLRQSAAGSEPWVEVFHSERQRKAVQGIAEDQRRLDGFVLGAAAAVNAYWRMGMFFGAQRAELMRSGEATQADIRSTHFGLHMAAHVMSARLLLGAARSWHRLSSERTINAGALRDALGARYRGETTQVFGEVSWPLFDGAWPGEEDRNRDLALAGEYRLGLTPFARMAWVRTNLNGFVESGGPAALNVRAGTMRGWESALGLRAQASVADPVHGGEAAKVFTQLAWHRTGYSGAGSVQSFRESATHTLFVSQGLTPARAAWSLQLGMEGQVGKASTVGFSYLGHFGSRTHDHGIGGWARLVF